MYIRVLEDSERLVDAARGQKLTVSEQIYSFCSLISFVLCRRTPEIFTVIDSTADLMERI